MKTRHMLRALLALLLTLTGLAPPAARAQGVPLPCCEDFSDGSGGWSGIDLSALNIQTPGPAGAADNFLYAHDDSGASWTLGNLTCPPNWLELMSTRCLKLTWDVQLINDSDPQAFLAPLPRIYIFASPTLGAYFTANVPGITEPGGPNPGWHHVCAPIGPLNSDGTLPSFPEGTWKMYNRLNPGSPPADSQWPVLLASVTQAGFFADLTSRQTEEWGYDNICLEERECGCFKVVDPRTDCVPNTTGGFNFTYSFTLLNESGQTVNAVLVPPSLVTPPGVTVSPAAQPVNIPNGGTAPVTFTISGATGGQEVCFTLVLMNFVEGECCRGEVCVKLPCLKIRDEHTTCVPHPALGATFTWSATVTNLTAVPAAWAMLIPESPTTAITPTLLNLGSLPPGGSASLAPVTISGATPGQPFYFTIVVFDQERRTCCFQRHCVVLPDCPIPALAVLPANNGTPAEPCKASDPGYTASPDGCIKLCRQRILCDPARPDCYTWSFTVTNGSTTTMTQLAVPVAGASPQFITFNPPLAPGQAAQCTVTICGAAPGPFTVPLYLVDVKNCKCCSYHVTLTLPRCDCLQVLNDRIDCLRQADGTFCYTYTATWQNLSGGTVSHLFLVPSAPASATFSPSYFNIGSVPHGGTATFTTTICNTGTAAPLYFHITIHNDDFTVCCAIRHCVQNPSCCDCDRTWVFEGGGGAAGTGPQLPPGTTLLNVQMDQNGKIGFDPNGVAKPFPYVYMAASNRATIVRVDANTGTILGEFQTCPQPLVAGSSGFTGPSRTTVDKFGECWVGNRWHSPQGSVARIGLVIGGTRWDKTGPFTYVANPNGEYRRGPFTYISPSVVDRDIDGYIRTSTGVGNILPWDPTLGGGNNAGGVSLAEDECIVTFTRTVPAAVRALALDQNNDLWVGGWGVGTYQLINGVTGAAGATIPLGGGYGCLIDSQNVLWSVNQSSSLERWDLTTNTGLPSLPAPGVYGITINPCDNHIWTTSVSQSTDAPWQAAPSGYYLRRWSPGPAGTWVASYPQRLASQGLCVDSTGTLWLSNIYWAPGVDRYTSGGAFVTTILGGTDAILGATGCAVDHNGKIWASDFGGNQAVRIDPSTNLTDAAGDMNPLLPVLPAAQPYNYSDMTGFVGLNATGQFGMMQFQHDALCPNIDWGRLTWLTTGESGRDCRIVVEVRASNNPLSFTGPWHRVTSGEWFCNKGIRGQHIQVRISFFRPPGCPPVCNPRLCRLRLQCCDPNNPGDVDLPVFVEPSTPIQANPGAPVVLTAFVHDPEGRPLTAQLDFGPSISLPISPDGIISFSGLVFSTPGIRTATLTVSDGVNTTVKTITILVGDRTPPVMSIPAPLTIAAFSAEVPDFRAEAGATDDSGEPVTVVQTPPPGTTVPQGNHLVTIRATDAAGNSMSVTTWVFVTPLLAITAPINYAVFPTGSEVTVFFTGSDAEGIAQLELVDNGQVIPVPPAQGRVTFTPAAGQHTIAIRARNTAGLFSTSQGRQLAVHEQIFPPAPFVQLQPAVDPADPNAPRPFTLRFEAPAGVICCIQKTTDLEKGPWITEHIVTGAGQHVEYPVTVDPAEPKGFYRVLIQNP